MHKPAPEINAPNKSLKRLNQIILQVLLQTPVPLAILTPTRTGRTAVQVQLKVLMLLLLVVTEVLLDLTVLVALTLLQYHVLQLLLPAGTMVHALHVYFIELFMME